MTISNKKLYKIPYFHSGENLSSVQRPAVLYGCETWYLTLRDEHKLRVFENRVLRRILGT
jgi:hypothetical protein